VLGFAISYFLESGLFNGLRSIQIKDQPPFPVVPAHISSLSPCSLPALSLASRLIRRREIYSTDLFFRKENVGSSDIGP
jgi:hypothetical protein